MTTRTLPAWSKPSTFEATQVHHGYRTAPGFQEDVYEQMFIAGVEGEIKTVWWAMLEPGGYIIPHIDASPWFTRWHFPIEPAGYLWENGDLSEPTEPFTVTHWEPHAVWNPTDRQRIHLIVDLMSVPAGLPAPSGLVLCDMIPAIQELM